MPSYALESLDRDTIRLELRGDVNMKRYAPEVVGWELVRFNDHAHLAGLT